MTFATLLALRARLPYGPRLLALHSRQRSFIRGHHSHSASALASARACRRASLFLPAACIHTHACSAAATARVVTMQSGSASADVCQMLRRRWRQDEIDWEACHTTHDQALCDDRAMCAKDGGLMPFAAKERWGTGEVRISTNEGGVQRRHGTAEQECHWWRVMERVQRCQVGWITRSKMEPEQCVDSSMCSTVFGCWDGIIAFP
jgi:hypothetical protein